MLSFLARLFDTNGFPARWDCGEAWSDDPWLGWLHIVSDVVTFCAYYAVPSVVIYFMARRPDIRFPRVFYVFLGLIFFSCGTVHLLEAGIFWWPVYRISALAKALTAIVSAVGVVVLARLLPAALSLKSAAEFDREQAERKRVQDSLEFERNLLHTLMNHLPDSIYFKDKEGRFLRISRELADKFALADPTDAIGRCENDFFSPEHAQRAAADEQQIMASRQPLVGVVEHETWPSGSQTWVSTTKAPLHDHRGELIGTFGVSHDITRIKEADDALRKSEERFQLAVRGSSDGIWDWDLSTDQVYYSPRMKQLIGFADTEMENVFAAWRQLLHPEDVQPTLAAVDRHLQLREPYDVEYRLATKSGEYRWFRARGQAIWDENGNPTRMAGSITDITADKANQLALVTAKEDAVAAQEDAEAANHAKSDFLANMSHEIRTPMNAIIGMTELVLETELTAAQKDYLSTVLESAESLLTIINEILDFAKIEAGKISLECETFSLRNELGDTMKTLALRAHQKNLELAWSVAADVPDLLIGDGSRLRQIIVNLSGNAIKFTSAGEVVLEVTAASREGDTIELHFSVSDTGIGIAEHQLQNIFQAFEQGDSSTTRRFGGTGLGLAICGTLVEMMGGRIWVESQLNRGSKFHFTARFQLGRDKPREPRSAVERLHGMRILVVDDNATNRRILQEMLTNWGLDPLAVADAHSAIEHLREAAAHGQAIPLILTDVNMPDMDGFMLAAEIRSLEIGSDAIILVLTSGGRIGDARRCAELGIAMELLKPVKQSELLNAIMTATTQIDEEAVPTGEPSFDERATTAHPSADRALKVLVAEDGLANQKLAIGILKSWGHRPTVAQNGLEAVALAASGDFDLILMDVQMPEMDGLEATLAIRQREQTTGQHIPILAMTAHAMKGDRQKCLDAGMDGYLTKPIRRHELRRAIFEQTGTADPEAPIVARHTGQNHDGSPKVEESSLEEHSHEGESHEEHSHEGTSHDGKRLDGESMPRPFDWAGALEAVGGEMTLLRDVAQAALRELPDLLSQLRVALANGNGKEVVRLAHTIKGNASFFAATDVERIARQIEVEAKVDGLAKIHASMTQLETQLSALCDTIRQHLMSPPA